MRRLLLTFALLLIALAAAACTGSAGPGWTYAPPTEAPPVTPAPSGEASEAPGSEAPGSEAPSDGGGGTVVQLSALNVQWEQKELSAPADTAFTIRFDNKDASVPHDLQIKDASGMEMFKGDVVTGPAQFDYQVPALPAGTYQFICTIHPNMIGTLTVGG